MSAVATSEYEAGRAASDGGRGERTVAELVGVLRRRLPLIFCIAGAIVGVALIYVITATRLYTASSVVLLEPRSSLSQADGLRYSFASDSALVDSQIKLLTSEAVLRRAVEREGLQEDQEFGQPATGLWWSLRKLAGLAKNEAEQRTDNFNATVMALAAAATVKRPERTYVMEVSVVSREPAKAARLANAIAKSYIADQTDARSDISRREQDFLEGNIAELRRRIEKAENEVERYKEENRIIGASGKLVNEQMLAEINTELASTRARTTEARSRHEQVRQVLATGRSVDTLPEALKSPVVDKLRIQFAEIVRQEANAKSTLGALHPQYREIQQQLRDTRRLITEELARIAEGALNDLRIAEANEAGISRQVDQLKREATTTNQSSVKLRELEREVDTNKSVLDNLLKAKGNVTRDSMDMPIARIIARASPPTSPSSPRRIPIILLAAAAGLGLGAIAAFGAEGFGLPRVRPAAEARRAWMATRLPPPTAPDRLFAEVAQFPSSPYATMVRELAARAPASAPQEPGTCLVIACGAGDAAAAFAANLAQACAAGERPTLLVELSKQAGPLSHALARDLPIGVVALAQDKPALGILAAHDGARRRLVIAPAAFGQRSLRAPRGIPDRSMLRLGAAQDFDLVIGYAPDAASMPNADQAIASSGLIVFAIDCEARLSAEEEALIDHVSRAIKNRCLVVATGADAA